MLRYILSVTGILMSVTAMLIGYIAESWPHFLLGIIFYLEIHNIELIRSEHGGD